MGVLTGSRECCMNNTILSIWRVDFVSELVENSAQFQNHIVWNPIINGGNLLKKFNSKELHSLPYSNAKLQEVFLDYIHFNGQICWKKRVLRRYREDQDKLWQSTGDALKTEVLLLFLSSSTLRYCWGVPGDTKQRHFVDSSSAESLQWALTMVKSCSSLGKTEGRHRPQCYHWPSSGATLVEPHAGGQNPTVPGRLVLSQGDLCSATW